MVRPNEWKPLSPAERAEIHFWMQDPVDHPFGVLERTLDDPGGE